MHFERWKLILIAVVCLLGGLYAAPNMLPVETTKAWQESMPGWLPVKTVNLGLDLRGGSHLLLEVQMNSVIADRAASMVDGARAELRRENIGYVGLAAVPRGVVFTLRDPADADRARKIARGLEENLDIKVGGDGKVEATFDDQGLIRIKDQVIGQSIEIVRRRIDETGTREPIIQRQGADRILVQLPGVDDPARIKALLGKTAKMTFHLVDNDAVSSAGLSPASRVLPMAEKDDGGVARTIAIRKRVVLSGDMLTDSQPTFEQGAPVVSFRFNAVGSRKFCDTTRENVGQPFAIVLDEQVISAPVIRDAICGGAGIISGNFTVKEAQDLSLLLRAGALPAPLEVIEERTVGPSLGADSIADGKKASLYGFAFVIIFVLAVYALFGVFATAALIVNMVLLFALLSLLQATLTLPGIAGIVLTMGMAIDANVLIFERMREEVRSGRSIISAIDAGYRHAFTAIIDSNLTTLIAALFLFSFGSGPVRGFAVTLALGVLTSLFSAIWITRLLVAVWYRRTRPQSLPV